MQKNDYSNPWKSYAARWKNLYSSPGKPSAQECKIYNQFIKKTAGKKKNAKALVLGSTPEIRDELAKFNIDIHIIDINMEMILAMTELVSHNKKETIIKGDWLSNPLEDNYFDIVLGDLVISNVPPEKQVQFIKEISRLLKKGGHSIVKTWTYPKNWQKHPTKEVLQKFSKLGENKKRHSELFVELLYNTYNKKTRMFSTKLIKKELKPYFNGQKLKYDNKKVEKWMNKMWDFWKPMDKVWGGETVDREKKKIEKYLKVTDEKFAKDYMFVEYIPMWLCKKY